MSDIYTPAEVAECKAKADSRGCDHCQYVGSACCEERIPALCATIETLRATLAAKEETQRALESENAELQDVVRELGEVSTSDYMGRGGVWAMVPMSLILRARELR